MILTKQQQSAFDKATHPDRPNIYLGGIAGSGKSVLMTHLKDHFGASAIVCAPTGIAALNIGAVTIHSLMKLSTGILTPVDGNSGVKLDIFSRGVRTLIIDEISMVRADVLTTIDLKLRRDTGFDLPFGGVQIIACGDMLQLEPIVTNREEFAFHSVYDSKYPFLCDSWTEAEFEVIELTENIRQETNPTFQRALTSIRRGGTQNVLDWINKKLNDNDVSPDVLTLVTTNKLKDQYNSYMYDLIPNKEYEFTGKMAGIMETIPVPLKIKIKVGMRAIICGNDVGYVNGECGEISSINGKVMILLDSGIEVEIVEKKWEEYDYKVIAGQLTKTVSATYTQLPILPAYAITIHRAQGMTFEEVNLDFGTGTFCNHQLYVAISRCKNLDRIGLYDDIKLTDIDVSTECLEFYK